MPLLEGNDGHKPMVWPGHLIFLHKSLSVFDTMPLLTPSYDSGMIDHHVIETACEG